LQSVIAIIIIIIIISITLITIITFIVDKRLQNLGENLLKAAYLPDKLR